MQPVLLRCFAWFPAARRRLRSAREAGFYDTHKDFYNSKRHENFFGRDFRYYYLDGDDSVDEQ